MYAEYDFTVNQDFTTVSKNLENGGRYWKKSNDDTLLHKKMEQVSGEKAQTRFNGWIAARITDYDFVGNQDFVSFLVATKKPNGGRPSQQSSHNHWP